MKRKRCRYEKQLVTTEIEKEETIGAADVPAATCTGTCGSNGRFGFHLRRCRRRLGDERQPQTPPRGRRRDWAGYLNGLRGGSFRNGSLHRARQSRLAVPSCGIMDDARRALATR